MLFRSDGLAGNQTLSSLYKTSSGSNSNVATSNGTVDGPTPTTNNTTTNPYSSYSYDPTSNTAYQNALKALQNAQNSMPGYSNSYKDQLDELYNKILNKEKFSYDLNTDMLYNQYKDQYVQQGKMAMMDTMGQAAALTGGYGNSYASTAGNQAYQGYLQQLNDIVPELYQNALNQYNEEYQNLYNQYSLVDSMADDEYSKYIDSLNQYWQNLNYQKELADDEYTRGYENWYKSITTGSSLQKTQYDNLVSLITTTGYTPTAEELKAAGMSTAQAEAYKKYYTQTVNASSSSSSSLRSYDSSDNSDTKDKRTSDGTDGGEAYAKKTDAYSTGQINNPYLSWSGEDWISYFKQIVEAGKYKNKASAKAALEEEFNYLVSKGYIAKTSKGYITAALAKFNGSGGSANIVVKDR